MTYNKYYVRKLHPEFGVHTDTTGAVRVVLDDTGETLFHYEIDYDYLELNGDYSYERSEENGVVHIEFLDFEGACVLSIDAYIEEAQDA